MELDRMVINRKKMLSKIQRQALITAASNKHNGIITNHKKIEVGSDSKKLLKGEAGEEDVDIGDEMPTSHFPLVEIEKHVTAGGCHGSSSSSGSSGSSSNDSSSFGSSFGSDSEDNAQ